MPTDDTHDTADETHGTAREPDESDGADGTPDGTDGATADGFTVTPYAVEGEVDYARLLDRFGADELADADVAAFPDPHTLLRRRVFYAGRDVRRFTDAAARGDPVSVVTGRGPSGPMHLGHVLPFYLAKHLQETTGAHVYVPLSDDEKLFSKGLSESERRDHVRDNLRDVLAVGFDPDRTRIVVDTADADALYPTAARLAADLTTSTVEAAYGDPPNAGLAFYPAMQATHLLLPQLLRGPHPTLVPVAADQDPHVRVCRDLAAKEQYDVEKPAALLSKFLPSLDGPGKMSSSDDAPAVHLTDDRATVREKVDRHAHSGGASSVETHRREGGDPDVDTAYRYLHAFFEPDDERLAETAAAYRAGDLLSGELKARAADAISDFLDAHQSRRPSGDVAAAAAPYRLREGERERLRAGL